MRRIPQHQQQRQLCLVNTTVVKGRRLSTLPFVPHILEGLHVSSPAAIGLLALVHFTAQLMEGVVYVSLSHARRLPGTELTFVWVMVAAKDVSLRAALEEPCSSGSPYTASLMGAGEGVSSKTATSPPKVGIGFAYPMVGGVDVLRKDATEL